MTEINERTEYETELDLIRMRRKAMSEGVHVTFDFGGPLTGVVVPRVPWAPPGTISVRLDSNGAVITPHVLRCEVRPAVEPFYPDGDCHDDPAVGGDVEQRCALTETCTLRCYLRFQEGEGQPNDWMFEWGMHKEEQ